MPAVTGVTLKMCENQCAANVLCRAFTYNGGAQRRLFPLSCCIHEGAGQADVRPSAGRSSACCQSNTPLQGSPDKYNVMQAAHISRLLAT